MKKLSILIPIYNEEVQIVQTLEVVNATLDQLTSYACEVLVCDDGSSDRTWEVLCKLQDHYPRLQLLKLSRNFGKESAILALFEHCRGDVAILMDGDLQHPPAYIPEMLKLWEEGYAIVDGVKQERQRETGLKRVAAQSFYKLFKRMSRLDLQNASDFKLLDRMAIEAYLACPEQEPFFRALSAWIGFHRTPLLFEVAERTEGESKWSSRQLWKLALQAFTSFSAKPLQLVTWMGSIFWIFAFILGVHTLVRWVMGTAASGFTTVILLLLILGGAILFSLGLIGSYIARLYEAMKQRPRYLLSDKRFQSQQRHSSD